MPDDFIEFLKKNMEAKEDKRKVVREIPMRAEWTVAYKNLHDIAMKMKDKAEAFKKEIDADLNVVKYKKDALWVMIRGDAKEYGDLRINEEKNVVEVLIDE